MFKFRSLWRFSTVQFHQGASVNQALTENVQLRGVTLKGRFNDLPNMLFFPSLCDPVENWIPFFTDPDNKILNYRNVHILNPRNFGNSDKHPSFDIEEIANDVVRYMYQNQITMATLAGHGFGAKVALGTGCFHSERTTGVFAIDYSPMDQRYHEPFQEFRTYIRKLEDYDISKKSKAQIEAYLKEEIEVYISNMKCPKWRSIFAQNLKKAGEGFEWKFNLEAIAANVGFNKADSLHYWPTKCGLWTGRVHFAFPEFSRWVHLGTNTLPMLKICPQVKGFGHEIFCIQGDENPLNHWVYDFPDQSFVFSRRFSKFLSLFDGVHVLLKDRTDIGNVYIPSIINSRQDGEHVYSDYTPSHLYHNWRFNNVYKH